MICCCHFYSGSCNCSHFHSTGQLLPLTKSLILSWQSRLHAHFIFLTTKLVFVGCRGVSAWEWEMDLRRGSSTIEIIDIGKFQLFRQNNYPCIEMGVTACFMNQSSEWTTTKYQAMYFLQSDWWYCLMRSYKSVFDKIHPKKYAHGLPFIVLCWGL